MSRLKKKENYLQVAYSLLLVTPEVLEKYVDRNYPGGLTCALRNLKETLIVEKLPPEQWDQVKELIDLSQHKLHQYYDQLINNTVLEKSVLDILISKCVMTIEDREEVTKQTRQSDRNKMILDILMGRPYDTYHVFMEALSQSDEKDIIDQLHQTEITEELPITKSTTVIGEYIVKIQKNYHKLVKELGSTDSTIDQLVEGGVLSIDDKEEINSCSCTSEKVRCLLRKIHNEHGYTTFLQALREDTVYTTLADEVEATQVTETEIKSITQACRGQIGSRLDVDTMITLVSVIFGTEIPTTVPPKEDTSIGADLCRLKSYIRYIIKIDNIDDEMMTEVFPLITALLIRLGGQEIEEHLKTYTSVGKENEKKLTETLKSLKVQINSRIEEWVKNNKKFVTTAASQHVLQSVRTNSCVTVTGSSGSGKTAIVRHVALTLQEEGYRVIPIDEHTELKKYYRPGIPTVFIIDDMCGNFTVNQQLIEGWKQMLHTVKLITEDKSCKIIISCRLQIYKDPSFDILKPFKMFECNIISEKICLSPTEIDEVLQLYDFFPLLCYLYDENKHHDVKEFFQNPFVVYQEELDNLYNHGDEGKYKICALALCVMFNNNLKEEYFTGKDHHVQNVIEETCEALKLNRGTSKVKLKESLDTLDGTFICRQEGLYRTRHDKLFDFLTCYFGGTILQCIIQNSDSGVIQERFEWMTGDKKCQSYFTVKLPDDCLELYISRLVSDWSDRYVRCVFKNNNFKSTAFRSRFLSHVSELDRTEQEKLVNITDNVTTNNYALGSTALIVVSYVGYIDLIQWLLDIGADPNATRKDGISPLYFACQEGHPKVVRKLLECNNVDPNICKKNGAPPLYKACQNGHLEVVCKLLEYNNVDPNLSDKDGWSPLYIACYKGNREVVRKLLECNNLDANLCDKNGSSPLYIACLNGRLEVVCKLLECNNVDLNLCNKNGASPLYIACQNGRLEVVCRLLECNNVDPNLCNKNGVSPLYIACQNGHLEVVCKLLECNDVDPNLFEMDGWSPLHIACQNVHLEVVCKLLECNTVYPNLCNKNGASPLYKACQNGHLEVVCKLLECNNVDPNLCNKNGASPLYIACQNGRLEVVVKLLKFKANSGLRTNSGRLPIDIATERGYTDIVSVLKQDSNRKRLYRHSFSTKANKSCNIN